jgi:hypothetical protein
MSDVREGGCQCGNIRYQVSGDPVAVGVCHCGECQRQSGSAFGMSWVVLQTQFELLRGTVKTFTRNSDSGRSLECAFCPDCGTRLYHVPGYRAGIINVKPGTLDDPSAARPTREIWTSRKHAWVRFEGDLESSKGQPF